MRKMLLTNIKHWLFLMSTICLIVIGYWVFGTEVKIVALKPLTNQRQPSVLGVDEWRKAISLDNFDYEEQLVVLYNRVPKTGSTSFVNIAYDLCKRNRFHVLHINITANSHVLSLPNQVSFARNVTKWHEMKPALYHGHVAYLDFSKFQISHNPIYINLVRKPLDRLVSYYYFLRYGDNYRPNLVRKKAGNKITFDECVKLKQPDCDPKNMWLQIPFFCGHAAECWEPGSQWALNEAKNNLVNKYFLVGVTEQMEDFVDLLEKSLPRMFHGFREYYQHSNKSHLRNTLNKRPPSEETVAAIMESKIWKMENELYEYALQQFEFNKRKLLQPDKKQIQRYMYEKIKPK
ncbi:heparin sulfate O-sulfotransferase [Musca domestica]|uniref:Heparin sulfate O-sulfotransferase n=1 Tax=Musca domestica TaxID=7370 RepID=A0ABM3VQP2_MUSDO|nr:heparin sulfate O-sulfotransferase [Musca domestica]